MTIVTRQNMLAEKTRFLISVGGIALSVFLIAFLLSLFQGWNLAVGRFVERVDADIWVAREGTSDFLNAASILPADVGEKLASVPGVERLDPLIVRPMEVRVGDKKEALHLVGYDVNGGAGGPLKVKKGDSPPGPGEVIVDEGFAQKAGVGVGDEIVVSNQNLKIVGISSGGNLIFSQTAFVTIETARELLAMNDLSTFYLLHLSSGADPEQVRAAVEQSDPTLGALSKEKFASATRDRVMRQVLPILAVILGLAFVVGVSITGLTIYNATVEKSREFGILKAIGFTNGYLFRLVLEQSLATGLLGFVIGAGFTAIATRFVADFVPQFVTLLRWQDVLFVLGTTIAMSVISALLPVRRIANVDPVSVFS